jgi:hypothetical protein
VAAIRHWRCSHPRRALQFILVLPLAACFAQTGNDHAACPIEIQSLRNAPPFSSLTRNDQVKVLQALGDDIQEMAEIDLASSFSGRTAYKNYFISRLEFKTLPGTTPTEKLLLIRYNSNTMCGTDDNCPVWIVRLALAGGRSSAQSMVPWQEEMGTSAGGGWGVGVLQYAGSVYPELILLTHLSSTQTGLACYQESKHSYLRVDCSTDCKHLLEHGVDEGAGK